MRRGIVADLETCLRIYYENFELENEHIRMLFGDMAPSTFSNIKKAVREEMAKRGVKQYSMCGIDTKVAYDVWGLNVPDMEERLKKLRKLGFRKEV